MSAAGRAHAMMIVLGLAGCSDPMVAALPDASLARDASATDARTSSDANATTDANAARDASATPDTSVPHDAFAPHDANTVDAATASTVPAHPITFPRNMPFTVDSGTVNYVFVPTSYDGTHHTPTNLLVWLHGCGGMSEGDIWTVSPGGSQSWISIAVGGQEGNCWDVAHDPARVLAAIADLETHFNIRRRGVILGGYSSGGDLGYRTAFYNANMFAGLLIENSSPYRDTGSSMAASLAAASWHFNVVHLAHLQDTTYPIPGVRTETNSMTAAGFPMMRMEVDGGHYDNAGATENGHMVPGTSADLRSILLPFMDAGWSAP